MSTTTTIEIEKLLPWSAGEIKTTPRGIRLLRKASPTEDFWRIWRANKQVLKDAGISCSQYGGAWEVSLWQDPPAAYIQEVTEKIQASYKKASDITVPAPEGCEYMPYQKAAIEFAIGRSGTLFGDEMGLGKCQPVLSPVLTLSGWKTMGDIRPGDSVVGRDGRATKVLKIYPQGKVPVMSVIFSDNTSTLCGEDHLWTVQDFNGRNRDGWRVMTTTEIASTINRGRGRWMIPLCEPVQFSAKRFPIDPYILGVLLGDGNVTGLTPQFCPGDDEVPCLVEASLPTDLSLTKTDLGTSTVYRIVSGPRGGRKTKNPLTEKLQSMGLFGLDGFKKFIPSEYQFGSLEQRLALLQGLMDTDGRSNGARTRFSSTSKDLADGVASLVRSLGGVSKVTEVPQAVKSNGSVDSRHFLVTVLTPMCPFRRPNLISRWKPSSKMTKMIVKVLPGIKPEESVCIKVEAADELYITNDYIVTHNTIEAIGVINNDPAIANVLVICPARVRINWTRELSKWLVRPMSVGVANGVLPDTNVVVIAYTTVAKFAEQLTARNWDLIVMDEVHYLKNPKAQRTVAVTNVAKNTTRKIGMTGTPIQNRVEELFTVLNLLDPQTWNDRGRFMNRYVYYKNDSRMAELQRLLRTSCMIRRLKKDVLTELPAKRRQTIVIPSTGYEAVLERERQVMERYEQQVTDSHAELELAKASGNEQDYLACVARLRQANSVAFAEISRVRHETALAKAPAVIEHIQDLLEATSEKIVVFAHHIDVLEQIHAAFPGAGLLHGQMKMESGQAALDRFQTDQNCRLLVCSLLAGGIGLNMTAGTIAVFAELDWVPTNLDQAESRLHRKGQLNSVLSNYIILQDSLDHRMVEILLEKLAIIDQAMGDSKDADAPLFPNVGRQNAISGPITITMAEYQDANLVMPPEQVRAIHTCIRMLAGVCDGALQLDGRGFNKLDSAVGKRLAALAYLSPRQALLAQKFCKRYHRQLPADLLAVAVPQPVAQVSSVSSSPIT